MNKIKSLIILLSCIALMTGCGSLMGGVDVDGSSANSSVADETGEEAMVTAAIESLNSTTSSSESASSSAYSSLVKGSQTYLIADSSNLQTSYSTKQHRFRCDDATSATESFSCDNSTGEVTREVSFEDCELDDTFRPGTLNGGFTNTIDNGGDGLCSGFDYINFGHMVMGRDGENAVHTHAIDDTGMVFDVTKTFRGNEIDGVITKTGSREVTFSDPLDEDEDGAADEVTATIVKSINRVTTVEGEEKHNVTVQTLETSFTPLDEDGGEMDEVVLTYPVHDLTLDENGWVESRTVSSGDLIIDKTHSDLRIVLSVGDDGLTFYPQDHCGPYEGTAIITGYTLDDDGNYVYAGSGSVTYEDGTATKSEYNGVDLNLRPRPCS